MRSHIAILKKGYLDLILGGRKRLECRLTKIACPPFGCIGPDEKVLFKQSGGPVRARALVENVVFFEKLTAQVIEDKIKRQYSHEIMAAEDFWTGRSEAKFCTLVWLKEIESLAPYRIKTQGRRAWITADASGEAHEPARKV